MKVLPCSHQFCSECLIRWLELINMCPLCRREFPIDDKDYANFTKQTKNNTREEKNRSNNYISRCFLNKITFLCLFSLCPSKKKKKKLNRWRSTQLGLRTRISGTNWRTKSNLTLTFSIQSNLCSRLRTRFRSIVQHVGSRSDQLISSSGQFSRLLRLFIDQPILSMS